MQSIFNGFEIGALYGFSSAKCVVHKMSSHHGSRYIRKQNSGPASQGHPITDADLPPEGLRRWTAMRKAEVVACIRAELISMEHACERYRLIEDELLSWKRYLNNHGVAGLQSTKIQFIVRDLPATTNHDVSGPRLERLRAI